MAEGPTAAPQVPPSPAVSHRPLPANNGARQGLHGDQPASQPPLEGSLVSVAHQQCWGHFLRLGSSSGPPSTTHCGLRPTSLYPCLPLLLTSLWDTRPPETGVLKGQDLHRTHACTAHMCWASAPLCPRGESSQAQLRNACSPTGGTFLPPNHRWAPEEPAKADSSPRGEAV